MCDQYKGGRGGGGDIFSGFSRVMIRPFRKFPNAGVSNRVGLGWVGSGRVGSGDSSDSHGSKRLQKFLNFVGRFPLPLVDPTRPARPGEIDTNRQKP